MKKEMRLLQRIPGFSLLEVSISLLIIGIISSISISQLKVINRLYASQKTQSNIDFIVRALAAYCIAHEGKLPYPSPFKNNVGTQSDAMSNSFGLVPFKTLGIMDRFAKNGSGRWLLYKANPYFGKTPHSIEQKTMGISDFASEIPGDKVAFIIKSTNRKGTDEVVIWYSESVFISNFTAGRIQPQKPKTVTLSPVHEKDKEIITNEEAF